MERVRAGRAAIVAGLLVALYVVALFRVKTVPDWAVAMFGGPGRPIDRLGGLTLTFRPSPGTEEAFERYLAQQHGLVTRRPDGALVIELPALPEDAANETIDLLMHGGLVMKEVLTADYARAIGERDGVTIEVDQWRPDDGDVHTDLYLKAFSPEAMAQAIADYVPPEGAELAFEWIEPYPGEEDPRPYVRSYLVSSEVAIDGGMIANAMRSNDPNTNRPVVLLDFTDAGAEKFCALTGRIVGSKLATIVGGRVKSAPIINGAICGGRASVWMGGHDPMQQEREASALVAVLTTGALPAGGNVEAQQWKPAADVAREEWLARGAFGLVAGIAFGIVVLLAVRFTRPVVAPRVATEPGAVPWRRVAVTALAPLVLILGEGYVTVPGINEVELEHVMQRGAGGGESVFALGVTPIIAAYLLVELVALALRPLRWRRHDPKGRIALGRAVAALAIGLALLQGYFFASYFAALSRGGAQVMLDDGLQARLIVMLSLAAGTMVLALVAGVIREHGLGNGYAALLASAFVLDAVRPSLVEGFPDVYGYAKGGMLLGVAGAAGIAVATRAMLRWRVDGMRIPTSGVAPLSDSGGIAMFVVSVFAIVLGESLWAAIDRVTELRASMLANAVILLVSVPVWSWLFARPAIFDRVGARVTLGAWTRATALAFVLLGAAGLAGLYTAGVDRFAFAIMTPLSVMLATAAVLDIVDDLRAHRRKLVPAGIVHQAQYIGVLERELAEAGIPAHFHASCVRTLFAFFGPWAPIVVLVPEAHAEAARMKVYAVVTEGHHEVVRAFARDARPTPARPLVPAWDRTS